MSQVSEMAVQTFWERYWSLVHSGEQTSAEPVAPLEVAPAAQAHTASLDGVDKVFAYDEPLLQTVTDDLHCVTIDEDERVVAVAW